MRIDAMNFIMFCIGLSCCIVSLGYAISDLYSKGYELCSEEQVVDTNNFEKKIDCAPNYVRAKWTPSHTILKCCRIQKK